MRVVICSVVLSICAPATLSRAAQTQAINPVADTFVSSANASSNYGAAGALAVSAPGLAQGEFQTVARFDLASVKAAFDSSFGAGNWQITGVSLKLTAALPNNAIFNANAPGQFAIEWMQDDSWIEGTGMPSSPSATGLNFSTLPSFLTTVTPLGNFNFVGGNSGSATYPLTLQSSFANDIRAGSLVSLHLFAADSAVSYVFNSRTIGTATSRPELSITADAIPEPASLGLIVLAVPLLRRRCR